MKNLYKIENELYIISDNENINENDYIITKDDRLIQVSYLLSKDLEGASKVILTTNKLLIKDGVQEIDDEFLQWFVKNPNCEWVDVIPLRKSSGYYDEKEVWHWDFLAYKIIIPKEETKPKTMLESLQEYFKNTPKEKVLEDWNEFQHLDNEGITVKEFLENQKQETLKEAAEKYSENWEEITGLDYENTVPSEVNKLDFINGAKWQQEQDKNLYSEDDMIMFADFFHNYKKLLKKEKWEILEMSKEDIFKKWIEKVKKK